MPEHRHNRTHVATSMQPRHDFVEVEFWFPFCAWCHEKPNHPVHRSYRRAHEVCGFEPCSYCRFIEDPDGGVSVRGE